MEEYFPLLVLVAIVGAGLMSGLFFAFSTSVMRALLQLPPEFGMLAMQRINLVIINPLFLVVFLGTALLCLAIGAICVINASQPGAVWWLAGALAYLVGPFSVTMVFNVPLNNRLASAKSEEAARVWPSYSEKWLRWNHVRTLLGALSALLLAVGLVSPSMF